MVPYTFEGGGGTINLNTAGFKVDFKIFDFIYIYLVSIKSV